MGVRGLNGVRGGDNRDGKEVGAEVARRGGDPSWIGWILLRSRSGRRGD